MHDTLTPPPAGDRAALTMAEYARQSFHLARGDNGGRGELAEHDVIRALWCRRTDTTMRSLLCAIIDAGQADTDLIGRLLAEHRPDGAIVRRIGATSVTPGLRIRGGTLLLSLGTIETREILPLADQFTSFVSALGRRTRTHIRSSLRQFERSGLRHSVIFGERTVASEDLVSLAARNIPKPVPRRFLAECLTDINAQAMPFRSELREADGTLISVVLGYVEGAYAMLVCQLNPRDAPRIGQAGCSLLHRALLIRDLIGRGTRTVIMVNGCSGMLRSYCRPVMAETVLTISLAPLSWLRCLIYFTTRRYLWSFLFGGLAAGRLPP
jgi:hypothetical protein